MSRTTRNRPGGGLAPAGPPGAPKAKRLRREVERAFCLNLLCIAIFLEVSLVARLTGRIEGDLPAAGITYVGAFEGPRMLSEPVAWTSLAGPGAFHLDDVPPGAWYIHAVHCESWEPGMPAFPTPTAWGSVGGPYGYGRPVQVEQGLTDLRILVHPGWRDLTHTPAPQQPALPEYHQQAVTRAAQHLAASHETDGWLEGLLKEVNLTRSFLTGLFKRATGMSLQEFRSRALLERSKALLIDSELDVLQVALEAGWSAPQFTRLFKRYVGLSPGDFRRLARSAQAGTPRAAGGNRPVTTWPTLSSQLESGTVVTGTVAYEGKQEGTILYIGAFPQPVPVTYPRAWTALPGPGSFTLRIPAGSGELYILACYCRRRMRYPGDLSTSFADGGFGPVACAPGSRPELRLTLTDSDMAASFSGRWFQAFLPDGR